MPARLRPRQASLLLRPFHAFFALEAAGGIVLLACAAVAMVWANGPAADTYFALWRTPITVGGGPLVLSKPLLLWVNDGLMAVFFFVVGLEIKRADAPRLTPSMRHAMTDLKLDSLWVIYPGQHRYKLADRVEVLPFATGMA